MHELDAIVRAFAAADPDSVALATVVGVEGSAYRRPGAHMLVDRQGRNVGGVSAGCLEGDVLERAQSLFGGAEALMLEYDTRDDGESAWGLGLGCNGVVRILVEGLSAGSWGEQALSFARTSLERREPGVAVLELDPARLGRRSFWSATSPVPPAVSEVLAARRSLTQGTLFYDLIWPVPQLYVYGAEQDAVPLVGLARRLGWQVLVTDTRARLSTRERFSEAHEIRLQRAAEIEAPPADAFLVVMTHRFEDDLALLARLLPRPAAYLGVLGPRQRTDKLLGKLGLEAPPHLHAPVGLDIGGENPEQIALSILAQLQAVQRLSGRRAGEALIA